ncbi:unnamed protein product [Gordionus sp. m RMFG-2023]|uniref:phosphatase and actin regulator 2-like n=1 Tax=Gordionus sp. m RMFG-2023 TaxID=3053472 RepID=UPI0030E3E14E
MDLADTTLTNNSDIPCRKLSATDLPYGKAHHYNINDSNHSNNSFHANSLEALMRGIKIRLGLNHRSDDPSLGSDSYTRDISEPLNRSFVADTGADSPHFQSTNKLASILFSRSWLKPWKWRRQIALLNARRRNHYYGSRDDNDFKHTNDKKTKNDKKDKTHKKCNGKNKRGHKTLDDNAAKLNGAAKTIDISSESLDVVNASFTETDKTGGSPTKSTQSSDYIPPILDIDKNVASPVPLSLNKRLLPSPPLNYTNVLNKNQEKNISSPKSAATSPCLSPQIINTTPNVLSRVTHNGHSLSPTLINPPLSEPLPSLRFHDFSTTTNSTTITQQNASKPSSSFLHSSPYTSSSTQPQNHNHTKQLYNTGNPPSTNHSTTIYYSPSVHHDSSSQDRKNANTDVNAAPFSSTHFRSTTSSESRDLKSLAYSDYSHAAWHDDAVQQNDENCDQFLLIQPSPLPVSLIDTSIVEEIPAKEPELNAVPKKSALKCSGFDSNPWHISDRHLSTASPKTSSKYSPEPTPKSLEFQYDNGDEDEDMGPILYRDDYKSPNIFFDKSNRAKVSENFVGEMVKNTEVGENDDEDMDQCFKSTLASKIFRNDSLAHHLSRHKWEAENDAVSDPVNHIGQEGMNGQNGEVDEEEEAKLNMRRIGAKLNRRLSLRPTAEELEQRNILKQRSEEQIKLDKENTKRMLLRKLSFRPTIEELKERQIIRFNDYVETTPAEAYDRKADKPWTRLTPRDKATIRKELNDFKCREMRVHSESKHLTRFHRP